jgi:CDP-diacylglycerol---serine O-phosphatidyltransferase
MKRNMRVYAPGFLTVTNLMLGFSAIVIAADHGNFQLAAVLIIIASIIDALDGKVARFMNSSGEYGRELDSLADIVSFGVAPSYLIYSTCFAGMGRDNGIGNLLALAITVTPLIFGALRLARFNLTQVEGEHRDEFAGLPIPVAAVTVASFVLFNYRIWDRMELTILMIPLVLIVSLLMVSRIRYQTMPRFSFRDTKQNLAKLVSLLVLILCLILFKSLALFPIAIVYIAVGVVRRLREERTENDQEEDTLNDTVF